MIYTQPEQWICITTNVVLHYAPKKNSYTARSIIGTNKLKEWQHTNRKDLFGYYASSESHGTKTTIPAAHVAAMLDLVTRLHHHYRNKAMRAGRKEFPNSIEITLMTDNKQLFDFADRLNTIMEISRIDFDNPFCDTKTGEDVLPKTYKASRDSLVKIVDMMLELQSYTNYRSSGGVSIKRLMSNSEASIKKQFQSRLEKVTDKEEREAIKSEGLSRLLLQEYLKRLRDYNLNNVKSFFKIETFEKKSADHKTMVEFSKEYMTKFLQNQSNVVKIKEDLKNAL